MAMPYDVTTKELIEFNPPDWLAFLGLPNAPVKVVDADLATLSFEADKVLRVDDPLGAYLLHLDFQAGYDANFDLRVLRYNVLLSERHGLPVISVGVLLRPDAAGAGATGRVQRHSPQNMTALDFVYTVVRVWEMPPETFLEGGLALVPLAPIAKVSRSKVPSVLQKLKARLAQIMPQSQEKKLHAATYILMGLKYEKAFIDQVMEGVMNMRESVTYQAILREGREEGIELGREEGREEGIELGREEGREEGIELGREEGEAKALHTIILRQGEKRFGTPTKVAMDTLDAIREISALEALSLRLLEVESWDELLAAPK